MARPIVGQPWPFEVAEVNLNVDAKDGAPERVFSGTSPNGFSIRASEIRVAPGALEIRAFRTYSDGNMVPIFFGNCLTGQSGQPSAYPSNILSMSKKNLIDLQRLGSVNLSASEDCQVVSPQGWLSRFSFSFRDSGSGATVTPKDKLLWLGASPQFKVLRAPLPPNSKAKWIRSFFQVDGSKDDHSFKDIWFYETPDRVQSSAAFEFFRFTPPGSTMIQELSGICAKFVVPSEKAAS
ncbi:hypothetical protein ABC974_12355 [Sphingomonas oligophenolica]|uniref:Uncharacterized protein n=1 Tax=Sphingomonas oligophenolica TaxID=301154 RepID=A0ABU9Y3S1_9SPHN